MDPAKYTEQLATLAVAYLPKVALAIVFLVFGWFLARVASSRIARVLRAREVDPSLVPFLETLANTLLKAAVVVSAAGMVGIEMTSFVAILGAMGLAVGMALSGTLQNFAGGVILLMFRPFKVGDFIEAQGYSGTVREIRIFNTRMTTPDNKTIIIPNSPLSTGSLINYSAEPTRRVDFVFGIGYQDDIDRARSCIADIIAEDGRALPEPEPMIVVGELGDSSVNLTVRVWVNADDYWPLYFNVLERVKKTFDREGISIPFPQSEVHMRTVSD